MSKVRNCSFCGCEISKHNKGVEGIDAVICHQCLDLYAEIIDLNEPNYYDLEYFRNNCFIDITPKNIYDELSKHVIGQDDAKKILSVANGNTTVFSKKLYDAIDETLKQDKQVNLK